MIDPKVLYASALESYKAGSIETSMSGLEQARASFLANGDERQAATVANDLAVIYYLKGKCKEGLALLEEALAALEKAGDVRGQATAWGNLAQLMNKSGDKDSARTHYEHAAELFGQIGERTFAYETYRALSHMELSRGHILESLGAYDRALGARGGSGVFRFFIQLPLRLLGVRLG